MSNQIPAPLSPTQNDSIVVATPIWRERPNDQEAAFLGYTDSTNASNTRWLFAPKSLDVSFYRRLFPDWRIHHFPDAAFASVTAYSMWLTAPDFYRAIQDFEYVTICQLDAVLLKDVSHINMSGIDYIGAPWDPPIRILVLGTRIYVASNHGDSQGLWLTRHLGRPLGVGNGGLSIRRVEAHIRATEWLSTHVPARYRKTTLEDVLLCAFAPRMSLRIAPQEIAGRIFLETGAATLTKIPDVYGFHGLWRWNPELAESLLARET